MRFLRRGPEHCGTCGDPFIEVTYQDGYDRQGRPIVRTWRKCPRNPSYRLDYDRYQTGRCHGLHPFACYYEIEAWNDHRPPWRACRHHSVSEDGDACWLKDRTQLTRDHRPVVEAVA